MTVMCKELARRGRHSSIMQSWIPKLTLGKGLKIGISDCVRVGMRGVLSTAGEHSSGEDPGPHNESSFSLL